MVSVRHQSDAPSGSGGRLNLLLSWADWRPDSWVDSLTGLLTPMGVRAIRARSAREAERVIRQTGVHIAVVDLRLPLDESAPEAEEGGPRILELLRRLEEPPPMVVVKRDRSGRDERNHLAAAIRCDAFAVVDGAAADVNQMLRIMQRCLQRHYAGRWPEGTGAGDTSGGPESQ